MEDKSPYKGRAVLNITGTHLNIKTSYLNITGIHLNIRTSYLNITGIH